MLCKIFNSVFKLIKWVLKIQMTSHHEGSDVIEKVAILTY